MSSPFRRPFRNMSREQWQNIALASLVVYYAAQVVLDLSWQNFCGHLGIDYCAFWSAGRIASTNGYAAVYDLPRMEAIQRLIFPRALETLAHFPIVPTPYLPVFLAPFTLLSPLGPYVGYVVWSALNFLVFCFYLSFFATRTTGRKPKPRLLILVLASYPVFLNLFYGQVNIWLAIIIGEYMRAAADGKRFRAGLWLSGLLIKPQYLILIGIALLMQRAGRTLAGLAAISAVVLGVSYALIGSDGSAALLQLWHEFAGGIPSTGPTVMMNWRMLGLLLTRFANPAAVWTLIAVAMTITAAMGLRLWRHAVRPESAAFPIAMLGTFAATGAIAWHSHIYSAVMLICPLLSLSHPSQRLPKGALESWVLVPPALHFLAVAAAGLFRPADQSGDPAGFVSLLPAICLLGFNLYFVLWANRAGSGVSVIRPANVPF